MIKLNDLLKVLKMSMDIILVDEDTSETFIGITEGYGYDDNLVVLSISKLTVNVCKKEYYETLKGE